MVSTSEEKTALERRAKALFDEGVDGLDARTRSRLTQARHAAVAALAQQREPFMRRWLLPTAGLATAALVAVIVAFNLDPAANEPQLAAASLAVEDMDILSGAENIELLEDMEFYAWLESEPDLSEETQRAPGIAPSRS
jgi:hypothetical protein